MKHIHGHVDEGEIGKAGRCPNPATLSLYVDGRWLVSDEDLGHIEDCPLCQKAIDDLIEAVIDNEEYNQELARARLFDDNQ